MNKEKAVTGVKFHKEVESVSIENFGYGEKLNVDELIGSLNAGELIDSQVFKMFREQCEHLKAYALIEAIFLGDNHIYRDAPRCVANFIIANPKRRKDLEKLIKDNVLTNKTCLYSNVVDSNEIFCIHSDELMFPAHSETIPAIGSIIKMDNSCLVKVIKILDKVELE